MINQYSLDKNFHDFVERIHDKDIKKIWIEHTGIKKKFFDFIYDDLVKIDKPKILEFGVRHGCSTSLFLDICNQNNGYLYSIDINDYSYKFNDNRWKFICSSDNNLSKINPQIPDQFEVIFLDTIHKADHVYDIFYKYYDKLKIGGFFIIDDTSWLPYISGAKYDNFFKEVNNKETFLKLLEIYSSNLDKFFLDINFCDTGTAKITKINNEKLDFSNQLSSREFSIKNLIRRLLYKLKKKNKVS